jgi:hypothetical protein
MAKKGREQSKKSYLTYTTISINIAAEGKENKQHLKFVKDGCRFFFNSQHILWQLTRAERSFFDYICERMDVRNGVVVDEGFRLDYCSFVSKVTGGSGSVTASYVKKLIKPLVMHGLLLENGERTGFYIVNPKYAFAGPEVKRKKILAELILKRVRYGLEVDKLLPVPEEDFLDGV